MQQSDPFPIERCSPRLKNAFLAEFRGRRPTLQEIFSVPPKKWLTVPGIGKTLLMELEAIMLRQQGRTNISAAAAMTDAELLARLERLQRDLERFRQDVQRLIDKRPREQSGSNDSDRY